MTQSVYLAPNTWTLISSNDVDFQPLENDIFVRESGTLPTSFFPPFKIAKQGEIIRFTRVDGNFYGYSREGCNVAFDPV